MHRLLRFSIYITLAVFVYFLSYAPFLWAVKTFDSPYYLGIYYRAPAAYRFVEWCIVYTPAERALLKWSECFGVDDATQWQTFYFAQGSKDPESDFNFNIQE